MYKYTVEFIVCDMHQGWNTHDQEMEFTTPLDTTNLTLLHPLLLAAFDLEGDYAYVGIYNVREVEQEEFEQIEILCQFTVSLSLGFVIAEGAADEKIAKIWAAYEADKALWLTQHAITIDPDRVILESVEVE